MPGEDNATLVAKFLDELWNQRNLDAIDQFTVEDYVVHIPQGDLLGRESLKMVAEYYFGSFSRIHVSTVDQIDTLYYLFNIQAQSRDPRFVEILLALRPCLGPSGKCPPTFICVPPNVRPHYCQHKG